MKKAIGQRIAEARTAAELTQLQLAERLGVTYQAVSRWENGRTSPGDKGLYRKISEATGRSVEWLLYGVAGDGNGVNLPTQPEAGQVVPSVAPENIKAFQEGDRSVIEGYARAHFPCGKDAFRTVVADAANTPELQIGDSVIIDPSRKPRPGEFVAILVDGEPTIRVYKARSEFVELAPLNESHQTVRTSEFASIFIGTMTESSRRRTT